MSTRPTLLPLLYGPHGLRAGRRTIELSPLLDELKAHKAKARHAEPDNLVFPTRTGSQRDRSNVRARVLVPTIERANKKARKAGKPEIQQGATTHTLRRTFASLLPVLPRRS